MARPKAAAIDTLPSEVWAVWRFAVSASVAPPARPLVPVRAPSALPLLSALSACSSDEVCCSPSESLDELDEPPPPPPPVPPELELGLVFLALPAAPAFTLTVVRWTPVAVTETFFALRERLRRAVAESLRTVMPKAPPRPTLLPAAAASEEKVRVMLLEAETVASPEVSSASPSPR